jgi:recombinational DNA repair protein RecR
VFEGPIQELIDELARLPGIGPKSALERLKAVFGTDLEVEDDDGDDDGAGGAGGGGGV